MGNRTYEGALHAMQSGVAMEIELGLSKATTPKQLRVGVNSAMVEHAALVKLLLAKGVITQAEFEQGLTEAMNAEADSYEKRLSEAIGGQITLA